MFATAFLHQLKKKKKKFADIPWLALLAAML